MSDLKFVCPRCGQHLECAKAYVGHQTTCPGCAAEIRVPFSNSPGGSPEALPRAELVLNPDSVAPEIRTSPGFLQTQGAEVNDPPDRNEKEKLPPAVSATSDPHALHCVCPICHSNLQVWSDGRSEAMPAPPSTRSATVDPKALPLTERERQLAAAREVHQVSLYPPMKPRLAYILPDEQSTNKDEGAQSAEEEKKGRRDPEIRALNE